MDRETVQALPQDGTVALVDETGKAHTARVTKLSLHMRESDDLPDTYRFMGIFQTDLPLTEVQARWEQEQEWSSASADVLVWEPGEGAAVAGGLVLGIPLGAVTGALAMACRRENCEDGIALLFAGGLVGMVVGGGLGAALGYTIYRPTAPNYSLPPRS